MRAKTFALAVLVLALRAAHAQSPPGGFPGKDQVTLAELVVKLQAIGGDVERSSEVREDFERLVASHDLAGDEKQLHDYARLRLVFEATRDGGLWGVRWTITDREPTSAAIWAQWAAWKPADGAEAARPFRMRPSADGECDELSALCAFLARKLGVDGVGLFWPQGNHTVAVWTTRGKGGKPVRVVLPTSQIFLGREESLGTTAFDAWSQKTIYTYQHADVLDGFSIPAPLARAFVAALEEHAASSAVELQRLRNVRSTAVGGS